MKRSLEMTKVERSIVIDRPVEEVWSYVHDPSRDVTWQSTLIESEQLTDGPLGVGTKVREVRQFLGVRIEMAWEVTEYEPTSRSSIKGVSGPVPLNGSYLLEAVDGGTRLTVTGELDAHGLFKLAEPVFARMIGRELESNLGHLEDLLEAGAAS
jgi:carbon monoxide dehydrogenase subunit G